jgi:hypothetical protein
MRWSEAIFAGKEIASSPPALRNDKTLYFLMSREVMKFLILRALLILKIIFNIPSDKGQIGDQHEDQIFSR